MTEPVKLLLVFVNEADAWNDAPLDRAVVHEGLILLLDAELVAIQQPQA